VRVHCRYSLAVTSRHGKERLQREAVRELSVGRPCITLGFVLRETASRISYRDRHGTSKFISKRWAVHTEPCPSCPDYVEDEMPG
jgi:hypothetical protein